MSHVRLHYAASFFPSTQILSEGDEFEPCAAEDWQSEAQLLEYWQQGLRRKCAACTQGTGQSGANLKSQAQHWCEKCRKNNTLWEVHFLHNELHRRKRGPCSRAWPCYMPELQSRTDAAQVLCLRRGKIVLGISYSERGSLTKVEKSRRCYG